MARCIDCPGHYSSFLLSCALFYFQLADIIWDEADVVNDHIVPYPKGSKERRPGLYGDHYKKEWDRSDTNPKTAE